MPLGLSLGGADAANYTLSSSTASTTAFIAQATLTPVITADGRTYNGSTLVTLASQTASTPFIPDVVNLEVGASSFTSKSAGTETVTATGLSLGGADAANYTLSATTASTTAVIAQATLTPVITADGRTYNGSTLVTLASQTASTPFIPDVVNLEVGASSFTSKSAGTETVTATGLSLGGADAANYTLSATTASTTAVIAQATLTPVITADGRTYNGSTLVTLASQTASTPFIPDVVNLEVGASSFTSKSAGTETVTATGLSLSGADAANYTLSATTASTTAVIAQATLTPVITADGRTYNGSTLVTLASQTASTPFIPDVVNLEVGASSFTSKSAGTETVTATGLSLGGADAANYTLSATTASTTAVIAQATLTPVITADGRTYNGSTLVTLASQTASTPFIPDVVNLEVGASSFTSKSAGTETVTATGLSLGGADAANYTLSATTASTTAVIAQATLTPVITADGRTYNGSTLVTLASQTASTPFIPDVVNLEVGASSFTSKSAGTETVTATGLSLGGADAANYTLSATTASTTAVIAQATLTPVITADGRTYNGSTLVTLASQTASTPFIPDVVNLEVGASSFTSKSAGTETVTATGLSLSGADAANYTLSATTASTTAVIAQATLTPVITADGRTYNGSTLVTLASQTASTPFIPDVVNLEVGASSFTSKSAGTETVTATGLSLGGADAANYTLSATTASTTAVIAQATLTPVITADGRTYNGSTLVTLASQTASTPFIPDVVNLEVGASSFTSKSAGTETVTATGLSLGGADAANYTLSATTASTTAVIAQATLTPVITADGRTYNGSTLVTLASQTASTPFIPDVVNLEVGASSFTSKSAGTETVTATGLSLGGADAANYTLSATTASTTAVIAQATLTPVITADGRTYNGSTLVTLASQTASTPFIPDVVNLEVGASSFTSKSAGTETVTATGLSLGGADAANYTLSATTASTTAVIAQATLTPVITAYGKTYDGGTTVTLASQTVTGTTYDSDQVRLEVGASSFTSKNAGTETVTATGLSVGGADAANYTLSIATASTTASIYQATPTVNVTDNGGPQNGNSYPATAVVNGVGTDGIIASTSPSKNSSLLSFTYYDVTTGSSLGSLAPSLAGSYTVTATYTPSASVPGSEDYMTASGTATFNILVGVVNTTTSVTSSDRSVVYGKTVTFTAVVTAKSGTPTGSVDFTDASTGTDFGDGTLVSSSGTKSTWTFTTTAGAWVTNENGTSVKTFNVTGGDTITATYVAGQGFSGSSSTVTQAVTKATLTITAARMTKVYDGTTTATGATPTVAGLVGSDSVTGLSESFNNKNVGGKTLSVNPTGYTVNDGNGGNNYRETLVSTSGTITALPITVTAATWTKVYDGTTSASGATPTITLPGYATANTYGVVGTDTPDFTETYSTSGVGTGLTLTPKGSVIDGNGGHNYVVTFGKNTTGAIATMPGVIDSTSPGFSMTGTWKSWTTQGNWTYPGYLGNDLEAPYQVSTSPTAPATGSATWTYTNPSAAANFYTVYVTWPACSNRATNVPYTVSVYNSSGILQGTTTPFTVNQQIPLTTNGQANGPLNPKQTYAVQVPDSNPTGTGAWTWLQLGGSGAYSIPAGGWLVVGVSNAGTGKATARANQVEADAVMILDPPAAGAAKSTSVQFAASGKGGAAALAQAADAVFAAPVQTQSGTTTGKTAGAESDAWWLLYGEE